MKSGAYLWGQKCACGAIYIVYSRQLLKLIYLEDIELICTKKNALEINIKKNPLPPNL